MTVISVVLFGGRKQRGARRAPRSAELRTGLSRRVGKISAQIAGAHPPPPVPQLPAINPITHPSPRPFDMSAAASRAVLRHSRFAVRRTGVRNASSTTEAAREKVAAASSKASEGLSKVASSAGATLSKVGSATAGALGNVGSATAGALGNVGGRTGRLIGGVQGQYGDIGCCVVNWGMQSSRCFGICYQALDASNALRLSLEAPISTRPDSCSAPIVPPGRPDLLTMLRWATRADFLLF